MRELRAQLQFRYGSACRDAPRGNETSLHRDPKNPNVILLRDSEAEAAAVRRLEDCGFARAGKKLVMRKENQIARFFAFEYPRLKSEWKVTLSAQAEKFSHELQPLAPHDRYRCFGESWFELRYSLTSPSGETIAAGELQRLLRSGQNQTRLQNGRAAVFDAEGVTDFEEVLRDCEPSQNQPGVYRIDRAHAGYVTATARGSWCADRGSARRLEELVRRRNRGSDRHR